MIWHDEETAASIHVLFERKGKGMCKNILQGKKY